MEVCAACGLPLDTRWKFCIHCGARVEVPAELETVPADAGAPRSNLPAEIPIDPVIDIAPLDEPSPSPLPSRSIEIPLAVRPSVAADDADESSGSHVGPRKFRFDWQLALGVLLAGGGIAMIVYLVVVLVAPHA